MKFTKQLIFWSLFSSIFTVGCTKNFEQYNTDPTGATQEEMERDGYILSAAMTGLQSWVIPMDVNTNQFTECLLGGSFGGYLSDSNSGFNGKNFATYNPENGWSRVAFNDIIPNIFIRNSKIKTVTTDVVSHAVADIIKVIAIVRVTNIYGPIPYSKVGADGALEASYDSQEEVYDKMFEELDAAVAILTARRNENFTSKADIVYGGNVLKWIKLANSIKLRLALYISKANPTLARQKAEEAVSHEIGVIESNDDNAWAQPSLRNPFRVVMYEYNNGDSRVSADITSYMNSFSDPRRDKYFTNSTFTAPTTNGFFGLRSGIQIPSGENVKNYANYNVTETSKVLWLNAAEVAFLRAEGALRGWNMGTPQETASSSAEGFYNTGITLSFDQWGAGSATTYYSNSTTLPSRYVDPLGSFSFSGTTSNTSIKWDGASSLEVNLERIITQKWIAMFPLGIEAWTEFRRTGYPKLMPVTVNNSGGSVSTDRMARRLAYPQEEYTENNANVNLAVSTLLQGADHMGTDIWIAK
jgi:hypothetical protein